MPDVSSQHCLLCGDHLDSAYELLYSCNAFTCHFVCVVKAWDNTEQTCSGPLWNATCLKAHEEEALAAARFVGLVIGGGGRSIVHIDRVDSIGFCGWPGRGRDNGPMGWPGPNPPATLFAVPQALFGLYGWLRRLELSDHPITQLPAHGWRNFTSLEIAAFCNLHLCEIPDEIAEICSLQVLILMQNMLRSLPHALGEMPHLRSLSVLGNQIESLPEPFRPPMLKQLLANGNNISALPADILWRCPLLTDLNMGGNLIHEGFKPEPNGRLCASTRDSDAWTARLATVCLQGCRLQQIPHSFLRPCARSLQCLLLSDNRLSGQLPNALSQLKHLTYLHLYGNSLEELPVGLLIGCECLTHCLLEGNPFSPGTFGGLMQDAQTCYELNRPLRLLGVDASQVRQWHAETEVVPTMRRPTSLPAFVQSGWLVMTAGRWYGKLMPSAQVKRETGDPTLGERFGDGAPSSNSRARVLFVALAASQSEPEWAGELGRLHQKRHHGTALKNYACRHSFREYVAGVRTTHPEISDGDKGLMASLWADFDNGSDHDDVYESPRATVDDDFDVLLLVDPNRRWYNDEGSGAEPLARGSFRDDFAAVTFHYDKVCILGVSMGGFAALSCADLADTVLAFGPQIELGSAMHRPGFNISAHKEASDQLRQAVANRQGCVEVHTSMDSHLSQAPLLHPLPRRTRGPCAGFLRLVVHPFHGRIAKVLEHGSLLLPLLALTLHRLHGEIREGLVRGQHKSSSDGYAHSEDAELVDEWPAWDWPCQTHAKSINIDVQDSVTVLVGRWSNWVFLNCTRWIPASLHLLRTSPSDLWLLAQHAPRPGDWLCPSCQSFNQAYNPRCKCCQTIFLEQSSVVKVPGGPGFCSSDWECSACEVLQFRSDFYCRQCGKASHVVVPSNVVGLTGICDNERCTTSPDKLASQGPLKYDLADGKAYCDGCWRAWERKNPHKRHCPS